MGVNVSGGIVVFGLSHIRGCRRVQIGSSALARAVAEVAAAELTESWVAFGSFSAASKAESATASAAASASWSAVMAASSAARSLAGAWS